MRAAPVLLALCASVFAACETQVQLGDLPPCSATTCDGCCDLGECIPWALQSVERCGNDGDSCIECPGGASATCANGTCFRSQCGPCAGCCSGSICVDGSSDLSCGRFGQACADCGTSARCTEGVCVTCGPQNCAGCCNFFNECVPGTSDNYNCGRNGESCTSCGFDACVGGRCQ